MPKFKIRLEREVIQKDYVIRNVEAETLEDAQAIGDEYALQFDGSCPDDAESFGGDDCCSWEAVRVSPAADDAEIDD